MSYTRFFSRLSLNIFSSVVRNLLLKNWFKSIFSLISGKSIFF